VGTVVAPSSAQCPASRSLITGYQPTTAGAANTVTVYDLNGTTLSNLTASNLTFLLADQNPVAYNPMAAGTTVSVTSSPVAAMTVQVIGGGTVPNSLTPTPVAVSWNFNQGYTSGALAITMTSPTTKTATTVTVNLIQGAAPGSYVTCP